MHPSQIPEKPLVASINQDPQYDYKPTRVFFFKRNDGKIIATEEQEAWSLYTRRPQILYKQGKRVEFELIGTGDGTIYHQALQEAKVAGQTDIAKAQDILRKGQQAELEACMGKIIPPRNMDKFEL